MQIENVTEALSAIEDVLAKNGEIMGLLKQVKEFVETGHQTFAVVLGEGDAVVALFGKADSEADVVLGLCASFGAELDQLKDSVAALNT